MVSFYCLLFWYYFFTYFFLVAFMCFDFCITYVHFTFPSVITEAHADAHVGDASTTIQFVFLMLRINICRIKEYACRRFHFQFGFI